MKRWGWMMVLGLAALLCQGYAGQAWADDPKAKEPPKQGADIQFQDEKDTPTEPPARPVEQEKEKREDAVAGTVTLSDGVKLSGDVYLTRDKKLSIYEPKEKKLYQATLAELERIESRVVAERMEPEWRWKENANDEKVFTGKSYPVREYATVIGFKDGRTLTGECTALLYVGTNNGETKVMLQQRQKGEPGQKLEDLVYVKRVVLDETGD